MSRYENPKKTKKVLSGIYSEMIGHQTKIITELELRLINLRKELLMTNLAEHVVSQMSEEEQRTLEEINEKVKEIVAFTGIG